MLLIRSSLSKSYEGEIFGFLVQMRLVKTTAMRMLCGLSTADFWRKATIAGFDIYKEAEKIKQTSATWVRNSRFTKTWRDWEYSVFRWVYWTQRQGNQGEKWHLDRSLGLKGESTEARRVTSPRMEAKTLPSQCDHSWAEKSSFSMSQRAGVDPVTRRQFLGCLFYEAFNPASRSSWLPHYMDEANMQSHLKMVDGKLKRLTRDEPSRKRTIAASRWTIFLN